MKPRIAIFSVTYQPFVGGAEVAIREFTDRLGGDYEFDLFTARLDPALPAAERIGPVNVIRLGGGQAPLDKFLFPWRAAKAAQLRHKQNPYALNHAVLETYAGLAALLFKKKIPAVPYLLTMQSGDPDFFLDIRTWFWRGLYKQIFTKADQITAISQWLASRALKYGYKGEVRIIPNGVDVSHFGGEMHPEERVFIRRSWGFKNSPPVRRGGGVGGEGDFIIITASRLVHKNGLDILIDSLKFLPENVKLVIAGSGEDEEKLKFQVSSCKLQDRVVFLGQIDHQTLPRVLKSADIFARLSRTEGLGNAFLEAMAAGLPVVATPVGGIVDFLEDNITGLLAKPESSASAAEVFKKLITDKDLRARLAKAGQALAEKEYDWNKIAKQYDEAYQSLLAK